jgi:hypothetical protein
MILSNKEKLQKIVCLIFHVKINIYECNLRVLFKGL